MSFLVHVLPKNEYQNDWTIKQAAIYDEGLAEHREFLNIIRRDVRKYTLELDPSLQIEEDASFDNIYKAVETNNPELTKFYTDIITAKFLNSSEGILQMRDALRDEVERRKREKQAKLKKPTLKPLTTSGGFLRAVADPINKHMFEALTPGAMRKSDEKEIETTKLEARGMTGLRDYTSVYIVESTKKDIYGVIGYKRDVGEALWEFQQEHGALALQVHIALFARAYAETDAKPGEFITLRISDFCDDLQFTRKKGAHRRETKERVLGILECLTRAQMKIMYTPKEGKAHLFTGEIWQRGITHETADQHADLFKWEPETFNYAPGQYFSYEDWRYYTRNVALIGEGLLKLDARKDKWAIHIGGYLALLGRMNGYKNRPLAVRRVIEKTGLLSTYGKLRQVSEMEQKLERGLSTLEENGVIQSWNWSKDEYANGVSDLPGKLTSDKFFNRQIVIEYPEALKRNAKQIEDGKATARQIAPKKIQNKN
jgi:predicted GIY-YIG superfamily endonuclease